MGKSIPAVIPAPTAVAFGSTPNDILANIRVVDAKTGDALVRVISADSEAGKVSRFEVEDGNLVRENDAFKVIEEDRAIRIEWIDPPAAEAEDEGASGSADGKEC